MRDSLKQETQRLIKDVIEKTNQVKVSAMINVTMPHKDCAILVTTSCCTLQNHCNESLFSSLLVLLSFETGAFSVAREEVGVQVVHALLLLRVTLFMARVESPARAIVCPESTGDTRSSCVGLWESRPRQHRVSGTTNNPKTLSILFPTHINGNYCRLPGVCASSFLCAKSHDKRKRGHMNRC